jgi:hypothetical protein
VEQPSSATDAIPQRVALSRNLASPLTGASRPDRSALASKAMYRWQSMRPGSRVASPPSITSTPAGALGLVWSSTKMALSPSQTCGADGRHRFRPFRHEQGIEPHHWAATPGHRESRDPPTGPTPPPPPGQRPPPEAGPHPNARTLPSGATPDSSSPAPRPTVSGETPAARATRLIPPQPNARSSAPATIATAARSETAGSLQGCPPTPRHHFAPTCLSTSSKSKIV